MKTVINILTFLISTAVLLAVTGLIVKVYWLLFLFGWDAL